MSVNIEDLLKLKQHFSEKYQLDKGRNKVIASKKKSKGKKEPECK